MKSSPMIWHHVVNVKYTVKILSICVAFLETLTLTKQCTYILFSLCEVEVEIWRVLLKGNSWYFFTTEQILFEVAFKIYMILEEF